MAWLGLGRQPGGLPGVELGAEEEFARGKGGGHWRQRVHQVGGMGRWGLASCPMGRAAGA